MNLTDTQQAILDLIAQRIEAEGVPPSQTEIARAFGFKGVRGAQYHLEALEAAGVIERKPGVARSLRVLRPPLSPQPALPLDALDENAVRLPVLGQVAAGVPIGADIGSDQVLILDRVLFSPRQATSSKLRVPVAMADLVTPWKILESLLNQLRK